MSSCCCFECDAAWILTVVVVVVEVPLKLLGTSLVGVKTMVRNIPTLFVTFVGAEDEMYDDEPMLLLLRHGIRSDGKCALR